MEARITSLACSDLPAGAARWTLSLRNEIRVSLDHGPAVSNETIRQVLKKPTQALAEATVVHRHPHGRIPGPPGGRTRRVPPAEAGVMRLCFGERPSQPLDHVLTPILAKPNATRKEH